MDVRGTWRLLTWKHFGDDGAVSYPFGEKPQGLLVYTDDGNMMVQMVAADRPKLSTDVALQGTDEERAQAYATCLAYFGTYRVEDNQIVHELQGSLFPNWSNTEQPRPFVLEDSVLSLRVFDGEGTLTNEILWER
jgi:hypothetical protein